VIEAVISKDVLLMNPVQKPALLRQLFGAVCAHPAEVVSYQKILGQLQDAGNTVTIDHYLDLLSAAFLTAPLHKWSGEWLRQRASSPKIILRDNALVTAMTGRMDDDPAWRGRLAENAVGAALVALAESRGGEVFYWRERDLEVDFVVKIGPKIWAVEVKSGPWKPPLQGLHIFLSRNNGVRGIVIGPPSPGALFGSLSLEDFLTSPDRLLDI
jgi:hypothetical protein